MLTAYVQGKFVDIDSPEIYIEDRGYQFGDGIYEVIRIYQGRPWLWEGHIRRLYQSAALIGINFDFAEEELKNIFIKLREKNHIDEGALYIQVSRGVAPRKHWVDEPTRPFLVMILRSAHRPADSLVRQGIKTITVPDDRWARCHIKSLNLLPNILAKKEAQDQGAYEALFFTEDGTVTEGSSCNVFVVKDGDLLTHPEHRKILSGITRAKILEISEKLGLDVHEEKFSREFMLSGDEVFITATVTEMLPVVNIDDTIIGTGQPGEIFKKLYVEYQAEVMKFIKDN